MDVNNGWFEEILNVLLSDELTLSMSKDLLLIELYKAKQYDDYLKTNHLHSDSPKEEKN